MYANTKVQKFPVKKHASSILSFSKEPLMDLSQKKKKRVHEVLYNLFEGVRFTKKTDFNHVPYSTVFHQTFLYPVETFTQLLKPVIEKIAILTFNIILTIFIYLRSLIQ